MLWLEIPSDGCTSQRTSFTVNPMLIAALSFLLLLPSVAICAPDPEGQRRLAGLSLTDALAELQQRGLAIVFSSALVQPDMMVETEPTADDPRAVLDQLLGPHGLEVREGPGDQLVIVQASDTPAAGRTVGSIRGRVSCDGDPALLAGVTVQLLGTDLRAAVSGDGRFVLLDVPAGEYSVEARSPTFMSQRVEDVRVRAAGVARVRFHLVPMSVFLSEIVVTPSHFRILQEEPESRQFLSREEVDRMPHVADDLYRAVKRLPGAAGGDISAKFNVRGGEADEVLVILDGLELYEPFHLKDFQSIFSTVDAEAVGGVDFLTGGFPVEYGDRMSGVMDISIATPTGPPSTSFATSTINARFLTEGTFHDGKGQWLVSGRGWYPDALLDATGATAEEILSDYYDLLAKLGHRVGARSTLSADALVAYDDLGFDAADEEEVEKVRARYRSYHLWFNLRTEWTPRLYSQTVLSTGRVRRERTGGVDDVEEGTLDIVDHRTFDFVGLKQNWTLKLGERQLLKWGFDVKPQEADYGYSSVSVVTDPEVIGDGPPVVEEIGLDLAPDGESYGAYLGDRFRLGDRLVAELGLRWDKQSWVGDHQVSPRLNLMLNAGPRTTLRAAWGRFYQSQRLNELQVEDGVTEYDPAQLAEHSLASLEHRFARGLAMRIEAYHKELRDLRPRHENLFNPLELFPEARQDRVVIEPDGGRARGLEVLLKQDADDHLTWWISYALARAEDEIDGEMVPRSWDQRHAASFGLNLSLPRGWNLNLAGTYHTGWPTTGMTGEVVGEDEEGEPEVELTLGPRNRERFPEYRRLDLRASKRFTTGLGELTVILEVINLTDRENICCVDDFVWEVDDEGNLEIIREESTWAPIIPSLGVRWQF